MILENILINIPARVFLQVTKNAAENCCDLHQRIAHDLLEFIEDKKREEDCTYNEIYRLKKIQSDFIAGRFYI